MYITKSPTIAELEELLERKDIDVDILPSGEVITRPTKGRDPAIEDIIDTLREIEKEIIRVDEPGAADVRNVVEDLVEVTLTMALLFREKSETTAAVDNENRLRRLDRKAKP